MIHKATYIGKTDMMSVQIPYSDLMDRPTHDHEDVVLEVTISTNWIHEGEIDEFTESDTDTEGN